MPQVRVSKLATRRFRRERTLGNYTHNALSGRFQVEAPPLRWPRFESGQRLADAYSGPACQQAGSRYFCLNLTDKRRCDVLWEVELCSSPVQRNLMSVEVYDECLKGRFAMNMVKISQAKSTL